MTEPCRHLVLCGVCANMIYACPFCREPIGGRIVIGKYINE